MVEPEIPIREIQFWGHGLWGCALVNDERLDVTCCLDGHPLNRWLRLIRDRVLPDGKSLFWFRTCQTFGAEQGQKFATTYANFLHCRVAGHTHTIWILQSGLCVLSPGQAPSWSPSDGLKTGTPTAPTRASRSSLFVPNTITCLRRSLPQTL
jgi:hypothetical protein